MIDDKLAKLTLDQLQVLKKAIAVEVEHSLLEERQALLYLTNKFGQRKFEADQTRWAFEEFADQVELRGLYTEKHVAMFATYLGDQQWGTKSGEHSKGLGVFNATYGTTYPSWEAASRAILGGQAPGKVDDTGTVWDAVQKFRAKLLPKKES